MLLLPLARRRPRLAVVLAAAFLGGRAVLDRVRQDDLTGQVALVTGGSRGLGLLIARDLGRAGCRVAICARDADELNDAWRSLQAAMDADFWGTVYPTLAVLPAMRRRRAGRIANITSIGGRVAPPHVLPYAAAKFAATGFSEGLSAELARDGVRVTTIVPGFMRTGSYLRARFKPPWREEFSWFALGSTLPVVSVDAERAAREVVGAIRRGDTERSIGLTAMLAWRFHGLYPGLTTTLLGFANRLLPRPSVAVGPGRPAIADVPGAVPEHEIDSGAFEAATAMGRRAADRLNERSEPGTD